MKAKATVPLLFLAACLAAAPASSRGSSVNRPSSRSTIADAIVLVDGGDVMGSGTLIGSDGHIGVVLTAAHVVKRSRTVPVVWPIGHCALGEVLAVDSHSDLAAILVAPPLGAAAIELANAAELPSPGEQVELAGYGGGALRRWTARVHGYKRIHRQHGPWIVTDAGLPVIGDSGGPILYRQRLVGVISRGIRPVHAGPGVLTCGPQAGGILSFCRDVLSETRASDVGAGSRFTSAPAVSSASLAAPRAGGVRLIALGGVTTAEFLSVREPPLRCN